MKAAVWEGPLKVRYCKVPEPKLTSETDAIVRVCYATICGTDLHVYRGAVRNFESGTILGHEFVGFVEEVGSQVSTFKKGDLVFSSSIQVCGQCHSCCSGIFTQCEKFRLFGFSGARDRLDGGLAQYVRIPFADTTLAFMPKGVDVRAALLAADVLPTAFSTVEAANIHPHQTVTVLGCGPVGLAVQMLAIEMGAKVFGVDPIHGRLRRALQLGVIPLDPAQCDVRQSIIRATSGQSSDVVIEAVGGRQSFLKALDIVRPQGMVVGIGAQKEILSVDIGSLFRREIRLSFVIGDPIKHRGRILDLLRSKRIPSDVFFSHSMQLSEVSSAFGKLADRKAFKVVIVVDEKNIKGN